MTRVNRRISMRLGAGILLLVATGAAIVTMLIDGSPTDAREMAPSGGRGAERTLRVRVTGHDFKWEFRYPGPDGRLDTADDVLTERHLHLPAQSTISVDLVSEDYVYTFYVRELDLVELAVPRQPFRVEFETEVPTTWELYGNQMCGWTHPELIGDVVVHAADEFDEWLSERGS